MPVCVCVHGLDWQAGQDFVLYKILYFYYPLAQYSTTFYCCTWHVCTQVIMYHSQYHSAHSVYHDEMSYVIAFHFQGIRASGGKQHGWKKLVPLLVAHHHAHGVHILWSNAPVLCLPRRHCAHFNPTVSLFFLWGEWGVKELILFTARKKDTVLTLFSQILRCGPGYLQCILWGNEDTLSLFHQCNLLLQPFTEGGDVAPVHTVHKNSLKWKRMMWWYPWICGGFVVVFLYSLLYMNSHLALTYSHTYFWALVETNVSFCNDQSGWLCSRFNSSILWQSITSTQQGLFCHARWHSLFCHYDYWSPLYSTLPCSQADLLHLCHMWIWMRDCSVFHVF